MGSTRPRMIRVVGSRCGDQKLRTAFQDQRTNGRPQIQHTFVWFSSVGVTPHSRPLVTYNLGGRRNRLCHFVRKLALYEQRLPPSAKDSHCRPHPFIASTTGCRFRPSAVSEYSTLCGT